MKEMIGENKNIILFLSNEEKSRKTTTKSKGGISLFFNNLKGISINEKQ